MKKLTYLLLVLIIVACSSNDDNNQLFLEKYDNVVYVNPLLEKMAFDYSTKSIIVQGSDCIYSPLECNDCFDSSGNTIIDSIEEETENSLTIKKTRSSTDGSLYSYLVVYSVSESSNTLTQTIDYYNYTQTWTRTFEEVCD
jgi:hypothetical protein